MVEIVVIEAAVKAAVDVAEEEEEGEERVGAVDVVAVVVPPMFPLTAMESQSSIECFGPQRCSLDGGCAKVIQTQCTFSSTNYYYYQHNSLETAQQFGGRLGLTRRLFWFLSLFTFPRSYFRPPPLDLWIESAPVRPLRWSPESKHM